jgi:hypothetical protein
MGYSRIHEVIGMTMASIKALSCKVKVDGSTILCGPALGEVELLTALQGFAYFKAQVLGHPLTPGDWCCVTEDEFDTYQGSYHRKFISTSPDPYVQALYLDYIMGRDSRVVVSPDTHDVLYLDHNMGSDYSDYVSLDMDDDVEGHTDDVEGSPSPDTDDLDTDDGEGSPFPDTDVLYLDHNMGSCYGDVSDVVSPDTDDVVGSSSQKDTDDIIAMEVTTSKGGDYYDFVSLDTSSKVEVEATPKDDEQNLGEATPHTKAPPSPASCSLWNNCMFPHHVYGEPSCKDSTSTTNYGAESIGDLEDIAGADKHVSEGIVADADKRVIEGIADADKHVIVTSHHHDAIQGKDIEVNHVVHRLGLLAHTTTHGGKLETYGHTSPWLGTIHNGPLYLPLGGLHADPGGLDADHDLSFMSPHVVMTSDDAWDPSLYDDDPDIIHKYILFPHGTKEEHSTMDMATSHDNPPSSHYSSKIYSNTVKNLMGKYKSQKTVKYKDGETGTPVSTKHVTWQSDVSCSQVTGIPSIVPACGTCTISSSNSGTYLWINVSNAHLTNSTIEDRCALSGTGPGDRGEHTTPVQQKTMKSFQAAGLKWFGHFFGFLHEKGTTTLELQPDAWVKPNITPYVHIVVHIVVDDVSDDMLYPKESLQLLIDKYKLKLESTVLNVSLHLGYSYVNDDVTLLHYVDATLFNNWLTSSYVTRTLQFANAIPIKWFCKCPSIVEMATHESEFSAPGDTDGIGIYGPSASEKG